MANVLIKKVSNNLLKLTILKQSTPLYNLISTNILRLYLTILAPRVVHSSICVY